MSAEYPSVGLHVDLNEIVEGQAKLESMRASYRGLAEDAAAATKVAKESATAQKTSSSETASARKAEAAAAQAAASAQQKSDADTARQAEQTFKLRMAMTSQMFGDEARQAQDVLNLRMKLWGQQSREAAAADASTIASAAQAAKEEQRVAQATFTFRQRMTMQRASEDAKAAAAAAAAAKAEADAEQSAATKAVNARQKVLDGIKQQAIAAGLSKSQLAALKAEEAGVAAEAAPFIARLKEAESAIGHTGGTALKLRETLVIIREAIRGDFTRMAGSASILAQAFGALKFLLNPVVLGIIALTAVIVAITAAIESASEETAHFNNQLTATGNYAGTTATAWEATAQKIAEANDTTIGSAKRVTEELISSGRFQIGVVNDLASASIKLGELTGTSATDFAKNFERMKGSVLDFATTFNAQYHLLTAAQIDYIRQLEIQGDRERAEAVFAKDVKDATASMTVQYGWLEGALHGVEIQASKTWQALLNIGKAQGPAQQVADLSAKLADLKNPAAHYQQSPDIQRQISETQTQLTAAQTALGIQEKVAKAQHDNAVAQQEGTEASSRLNNEWKSYGGTIDLATVKINAFRADIAKALKTNPDDPAALSMKANQAKMEAAIRKRFDRNDVTHTPSHAGAENAVAKLEADIAGLQKQIDSVSADPLADISAKIEKAANEAAAAYSHGKNTAYQETVRNLAAEKEEMTIRLQLIDSLVKEARAAQDDADKIRIQTEARLKLNAAQDAYYASNSTNASDLQAMLQRVAQIEQDASDKAIELAIAQKFGAASINDIATAYLAALPPAMQNTEASKAAALQLEAQAKATAHAQEATAHLSDEEKRRAAISDSHTANLQAVKDLDAYTAALLAGRDALISYNLQKAINANLAAHPLPANATPAEALAQIQQVTSDEVNKRLAEIRNSEAQITAEITEQSRLAELSSAEREVAARTLVLSEQMILAAKKEGRVLTAADVQDAATQIALSEQWTKKIADLKIQVQDSVRDAFIKTGKLDFSSLKQGVGEAIRQAVYDQLIAKPINIVINAVMNIATQGIQSLLNSFLGTGGAGGGLQGFFSNIFGGGTGLASLFSGPLAGLGKAAASLTGAAGSFASFLGPVGAAAIIGGGIGSLIGGALGNKTGGIIGGILLGPIGAVIGGLLGDHSGHATAVNFNTAGQVSGYSYSPKGSTDATINLAKQTGITVQKQIAAFKQMGINADAVIAGIEQGTRNDARLFLRNGQIIKTKNGDTQALQDAITKALYQYGTYTNAQESQVVHQLLAANATLDQINQAVQDFNQAQQDYKDVTLGLLKYTDPTQYAIQSTINAQIDRRKTLANDIAQGFFSQDQINTLAQTLPKLEQQEMQAALNQLASSASGAAASLQDLIDAQKQIVDYVTGLKTSSLSNLSPEAILNQDATNFFAALNKARTGDLPSLQNITNLSDAYLKDAQNFFGSTDAYNAIFSTVTDALTVLGNQTFTMDPQTTAITQGMQELKDAIAQAGLEIVGAINDNQAAATSGTQLTAEQLAAIAQAVASGSYAAYNANLIAGGNL